MMRLVQIQDRTVRRVALVAGARLRLIEGFESVYRLAEFASTSGTSLAELVRKHAKGGQLDYDPIYAGKSDWRLLPPIDHIEEPARCLVSGTGLTHLGSAKNRQAMHSKTETDLNDSMKMFRWGVEGGKPARGKIGIAPEWFYKGNGTVLRAPNEPLTVPAYAEDGGEEAEIAGIYFIDANGIPLRIGMTIGNEFSDHRFEKKNYLNLAGSKLRNCALGPELVIGPEFDSISGTVKIVRGRKVLWAQRIRTGEREMCHSLANIEHHHFKFEGHRRPGDVHVHYFGACSLSFGAGIELVDGDMMEIAFAGFGRPLRNNLKVTRSANKLIALKKL
jgi:hypothetical protein